MNQDGIMKIGIWIFFKTLTELLNYQTNNMEAFDNELQQHHEDMDNTNTCLECKQPTATDKDFCSKSCYDANQY